MKKIMTTSKTFAETMIVAFHIGRGGHFNNAGHLTFLGQKNIGDFTSDLHTEYENQISFNQRVGYNTSYGGNKSIVELIQEEDFLDLEELYGITTGMLGKKIYVDSCSNPVDLTEDDVAAGIGRIAIDQDYNTTYTCFLADCSEKELQAIVNYDSYVDEDIRGYAREQLFNID